MNFLITKDNTELLFLYWIKLTIKLQLLAIMLLSLAWFVLVHFNWSSKNDETQQQVVDPNQLKIHYNTEWIHALSDQQFLMKMSHNSPTLQHSYWVSDHQANLLHRLSIDKSRLIDLLSYLTQLFTHKFLLFINLLLFSYLFIKQKQKNKNYLFFIFYSALLYFIAHQSSLGSFVQLDGNFLSSFSNFEWLSSFAILILLFSLSFKILSSLSVYINNLVVNKSNRLNRKHTLITYASQSGTAARIAKDLIRDVKHLCDISPLNEVVPSRLASYKNILVIVSTYGSGEAPENSQLFIPELEQSKQRLDQSRVALLALGDRKYEDFCAFGVQLNTLFNKLGAHQLLPLKEINQSHEPSIIEWSKKVYERLEWNFQAPKNQWINSKIIKNHCLNPTQVSRLVHHIQIQNTHNPLNNYQVGDLVEIIPENTRSALTKRVKALNWDPDTLVRLNGKVKSLIQVLMEKQWQHEFATNPQKLVDQLADIAPRTYSILSTPADKNIEILVRRHIDEKGQYGLASSYLSKICEQQTVKIKLKSHSHFRPAPIHIPMILIAAGTGIAPFIAFLRQRASFSGTAPCWLIFGERSHQHDNYFENEIIKLKAQGDLKFVDLVYSHCSEKPQYVSDRLIEKSCRLKHWLNMGAYMYLCGSRHRLGKTVEATLSDILGEGWLKLKSSKQYISDLY